MDPKFSKATDASTKTSKMSSEKSFVDITNLVRSIQRAEGKPDCFRKEQKDCDQFECAWRKYCLESSKPSPAFSRI